MATKKKSVTATGRGASKKSTPPAIDPKNELRVKCPRGVSQELAEAEIAQSTVNSNANTARLYSRGSFGESGLTESVEVLKGKIALVAAGDLSGVEAMLTAQATALDAIFTEMARRSALNMGEYLAASETYMRLALKAQSQCRTTLETLAEIKTPRHVSFVKQANIAHGHQQVNNGMQASGLPAHGNNSIQSNELSGARNELLPNTRASTLASRIDTPVEAVAEIDRAAN